jgi:HAD superfamily hydrolase (TIGR01484 family)
MSLVPRPPLQDSQPGLRLHLVSDLDGTWIPAHWERRDLEPLEAFLKCQPGIVLTFATGRSLESALGALGRLEALPPHFLVTDVGTAIHLRDAQGHWVEDQDYGRRVDQRWDAAAAERLLGGLPPGIRLQPGVKAHRRLPLEADPQADLEEALRSLTDAVEASGLQADILASNGRCLDVLPRGVDKGAAVSHLMERHGIPRPLVACGDSENDLGMLRIADLPVLMAGCAISLDAGDGDRALRPLAPGPLGILEVLRDLVP